MPVIRIEIPTSRDEAKKILALYEKGSRHQRLEYRAINDAWNRGHTPTGRVHFVGITNGQPPNLKFDVHVYSDLHTHR